MELVKDWLFCESGRRVIASRIAVLVSVWSSFFFVILEIQ